MDDVELLKAYADRRDQQAFSQLVRRHANWLYAAARRQLGDAHLAEDATQATFLLLAMKAGGLRRYRYLSGWLLLALEYCIRNIRRQRSRRQQREQEAATMRPEHVEPEADWDEIAPVLESALRALGRGDRDAVLLRFYEQKPLAEVGRLLGVSEEAARKRVDRAVDRLRENLAAKGVEAQSVSLSGLVLANAAEGGPPGLVEQVLAEVGGGIESSTAGGIAKGAAKMMVMAKVKVAAWVVVGTALAVGSVGGVAIGRGEPPAPAGSQTTPAVQPAAERLVVADVANVGSMHQRSHPPGGDADIPETMDVWAVRGRGTAKVEQWADKTVIELDDGRSAWHYKVGAKVVGRYPTRQTGEGNIQRFAAQLTQLAAPPGLVRDARSDRVVAGATWRCYRMPKNANEQRLSAIWLDDANRIRLMERPISPGNPLEFSYDEQPPAEIFTTDWADGVQVIEPDRHFAQQYPTAGALFVKEAAGIVFAVHECKVDKQGCYYVLCSIQAAKSSVIKPDGSPAQAGGLTVTGAVQGADGRAEPLGYLPHELALIGSRRGWPHVRWLLMTPTASAPNGRVRFGVSLRPTGGVQLREEQHGPLVESDFTVELKGQQITRQEADEWLRHARAEGERLWPALEARAYMAQFDEGRTVQKIVNPERVSQDEYVENVHQRIERALAGAKQDPSGPPPLLAQ